MREDQKENFPFEWYHDLNGKPVNKRFWEHIYKNDKF